MSQKLDFYHREFHDLIVLAIFGEGVSKISKGSFIKKISDEDNYYSLGWIFDEQAIRNKFS